MEEVLPTWKKSFRHGRTVSDGWLSIPDEGKRADIDNYLLHKPHAMSYFCIPEPLLLWDWQDACSEGKLSQSGRSTPNDRAVAHSVLHTLSLTSSHCPEVGWRETPELSHNPNRSRHRNGVTASLHSSLGLRNSKLGMRSLAVDSSSRNTRGPPSESQLMENSILSSSVWQIPPGVG